MQKKLFSLITSTALLIFFIAGTGLANVPPPPANQVIGIDDGIFNDLSEAECRVCHDDPDVVGGPSNVDRHHLLYSTPLQEGACSVIGNACFSDTDCNPTICEFGPFFHCTVDADCPDFILGETCGEICVGETAAPDIDANGDGISDAEYACLSCHQESTAGGVITFQVERDCLQCHLQIAGEASVHHLTGTAQGSDSPIGDPDVGDCTPCHGTLVDDIGDGHRTRIYSVSSTITLLQRGTVQPANTEVIGRLTKCNNCHSSGTGDPSVPGTDEATGTLVYGNEITHHNTGVFRSSTGAINDSVCNWCHPNGATSMYLCEGCHGSESLHNIQVDSNDDGVIEAGGELYGFGHIGIDDPLGDSDCLGCHGAYPAASASFGIAAAPGTGPITPYIQTIDISLMTAGTDTSITLTGSAFTNPVGDNFEWISDVLLKASDGITSTLTPDTITESSLTVTIPGTTAPGNYTLQAVKDVLAASNPVPLSIKPEVVITDIDCNKCLGTLTISGSDFSEKPDGTDEYINVKENDTQLNVTSWTDTLIIAPGATCNGMLTINTLFGSVDMELFDELDGDGIGDTCDCEGNFDCDEDCDGADASTFKVDFGRSTFDNPCEEGDPCNGDFDCDGDCDGTDAAVFKTDFGRSSFNNPCPACTEGDWCNYP